MHVPDRRRLPRLQLHLPAAQGAQEGGHGPRAGDLASTSRAWRRTAASRSRCRSCAEALAALTYGDLLMLLANQTRPYEKNPGETDAHVDRWVQEICGQFLQGKGFQPKAIKAQLGRIVADFETVELRHRSARSRSASWARSTPSIRPWPTTTWRSSSAPRTARSTCPGLMGFMLFKVDNRLDDIQLYGGNPAEEVRRAGALQLPARVRDVTPCDAVAASKRYHKPASYLEVKEMVRRLVGYGCKMGEGWLLTGEMMELIQSGLREHRLRPALRLPAQPHRRQGHDPPDPRDVSPGQHRPHRLRPRRHAASTRRTASSSCSPSRENTCTTPDLHSPPPRVPRIKFLCFPGAGLFPSLGTGPKKRDFQAFFGPLRPSPRPKVLPSYSFI